MKHTVFLVHGMGVHQPDVWAKEVTQKLKKVSKKYKYFQSNDLDSLVDFVPINYDNIINEILEEWKQAEDIIDFAINHATKIDKLIDQNGQAFCSIIAHSLGTAVSHDCIHILGTEGWEGAHNIFSPEHWKFQTIFMVANTSKLLESDINPYKSIVKPGKTGDKNSYLYRYVNFWHELDPVPNIKKFNPPWKLESVRVNHYREYNIHSFVHYLDNPKVHIPILRSITNIWAISEEEEKEAINNYPQFGGDLEFGQDIKEFIKMLEELLKDN